MNYGDKFKVKRGKKVDLSAVSTTFTGEFEKNALGEEEAKKRLNKNLKKISKLQMRLFSEGAHSLILVMQAMDAAGKDGTISKVFGALNPQGTRTVSFKAPSEEERKHHYLWRIRQQEPAKGHVSIFNRSHYEDVLIARVRDLVPEDTWRENFADKKSFWDARYNEINDYELSLVRNGTDVLKFFLHISPEEQLKRFWDRVANPDKNWKISPTDFEERKLWDEYQKAYERALSCCSTDEAPWFIIPADNKWFSRYAISQILVDHLESLEMKNPEPNVDVEKIKRDYFGIKKPGDAPDFGLA